MLCRRPRGLVVRNVVPNATYCAVRWFQAARSLQIGRRDVYTVAKEIPLKKIFCLILISFAPGFVSLVQAASSSAPQQRAGPNLAVTPGVLCSQADLNFSGLDYPEKIARCNRNIPADEKVKVAAVYGNIPQADWPQYEFDHLLPLCAGGSDDMRNLWPQPIAQAHEKDKLEVAICTAMKAGTLTQAAAVQKVYDWFNGASQSVSPAQPGVVISSRSPQGVTCTSAQAPTLISRFSVVDDTHLDGISLALNDGGDHEIISASGSTSGSVTSTARGPLLGLVRYTTIGTGGKDRFDLYVPQNLASARQNSFNAYVKISFEGTFPNLTQIACTFDASL